MSAMGLSSRDAVRVGCPLYPQKLPRLSPTGAAVMGHKRPHAVQQLGSLIDYLVGERQKFAGSSMPVTSAEATA
jgi:hypothetical protein